MNHCGAYGTNWGCPPGCGEIESLIRRVQEYPRGIVYQFVGTLEDSLIMTDDGSRACLRHDYGWIRSLLRKQFPDALVLMRAVAAGEKCTYPEAPCRFPDQKNVSVEACGIDVSQLCAACGLQYIHGPNTVTNTGWFSFDDGLINVFASLVEKYSFGFL